MYWHWNGAKGAWLRSHGDVPHVLEGNERVSATNVVVQVVTVTDSDFLDSAGNPSPEVDLTGSGKAYVLRDGTVIRGRWERESLARRDHVRHQGRDRDRARARTHVGRAGPQLGPGRPRAPLTA